MLDACFGLGSEFQIPEGVTKRFVLGGGAGFGGKSFNIRTGVYEYALRMAARGVKNPRQLVCCLVETDLEERQITPILDCQDIYPEDGPDWNRRGQDIGLLNVGSLKREGKSQTWVLTFHDKRLGKVFFRHAKNLDRRKGGQYDAVWVDELTQFKYEDFQAFDYLLRTSKGSDLLFCGVTNPDGIGNAWVRKLWVPKYQKFAGTKYDKRQFFFIQFFAKDNPTFNQDVENTLTAQEQHYKARWLGEWDVLTGTRFSYYAEDVHSFNWRQFLDHYLGKEAAAKLNTDEINFAVKKLLLSERFFVFTSFDPGLLEAAYGFHAVDAFGYVWTFRECIMKLLHIPDQAEKILEEEEGLTVRKRYCDPAIQGSDQGSGKSRRAQFRNAGIAFVMGKNDRIDGWATIDAMLRYKGDPNFEEGFTPPKWRIHTSCESIHNFLRNAPRSKHNPDDVQDGCDDDHAGDMVRYALHSHFGKPSRKARRKNYEQENRSEGGALQSISMGA
jgi:hypothetical protein